LTLSRERVTLGIIPADLSGPARRLFTAASRPSPFAPFARECTSRGARTFRLRDTRGGASARPGWLAQTLTLFRFGARGATGSVRFRDIAKLHLQVGKTHEKGAGIKNRERKRERERGGGGGEGGGGRGFSTHPPVGLIVLDDCLRIMAETHNSDYNACSFNNAVTSRGVVYMNVRIRARRHRVRRVSLDSVFLPFSRSLPVCLSSWCPTATFLPPPRVPSLFSAILYVVIHGGDHPHPPAGQRRRRWRR